MKLYPPTDAALHIGLTSGHTIVIQPEGTEVPPMFRREAVAQGCSTEPGVPLESPEDDTADARNKAIAEALEAMVDGSTEGDFNADGTPNLGKVKTRLGFNVSRAEVDAVWAEVSKVS